MVEDSQIYNRQAPLRLRDIGNVTVIGLGGIGSWIALDMALAGMKGTLFLIDPDIIEDHNLNRTPFKVNQIGINKAQAVMELIFERRPGLTVVPIPRRIEAVPETYMGDIKGSIIIDCRDIAVPIPEIKPDVKLGYDGMHVTMHFNPDYSKVWGETQTYTVTPSFIAPPQLLASLITAYLFEPPQRLGKADGEANEHGYWAKDRAYTYDIDKILADLMLK